MTHCLITKRPGTSSYVRSIVHNGKVLEADRNGRALHAHFPSLREEMETRLGAITMTLSSCRDSTAFPDPDAASIPENTLVILLVPLADCTGDATRDSLRLWSTVIWNGPHATPTRGDKLRQRTIWTWFEKYFDPDTLDAWKIPNGGTRTEIWIRPQWNGMRMFPTIFPKPKRADGEEEEIEEEAPASSPVNGIHDVKEQEKPVNPSYTVKFAPRTGWRFFNEDGVEIQRGFKSKQEATDAAEQYTATGLISQPQEG